MNQHFLTTSRFNRPAFLLSVCLVVVLILTSGFNKVAASSIKQLQHQQINEILFNIEQYYVDDLALSNSHYNYNHQQFAQLYAQLDRYSKYLDEAELAALFDNTNGHYTGLGIEVKELDKAITIVDVISESPAQAAGLLPGDIIISINNKATQQRSIDDVAQQIKNSNLNSIKLRIKREQQPHPISFNITRRTIKLTSVTSQLLGAGNGYLAINNFSNFTLHQVALHIATMQSQYGYPLTGLVIDLRDNPGGILPSAVSVADLFLHSGVIVTTKGRFRDANQAFYAKRGDILKGVPVVVLINENSASAAEIVAAALKDNNRAIIVGSQSFGKGSVQSLIPLGNGNTALKLTTAKYFTPAGNSIEGIGITPDVAVNQTTLSQTNKAVIIKNQQLTNSPPQLSSNVTDLQLVKAKQLLKLQ
jgi:carboxyl-terminal processing protease